MKTFSILTIIFALVFSCANMKTMCTLENRTFVVIEYSKSVKVWTVETLDHKHYASFKTFDNIQIGDTVTVETIVIGNVSNFTAPIVKVLSKR
jgi:hypothetical protein